MGQKIIFIGLIIVLLCSVVLGADTVVTNSNISVDDLYVGGDVQANNLVSHNVQMAGYNWNILNSSGSSKVFVNGSTGQVGIGTNSPSAQFEVAQSNTYLFTTSIGKSGTHYQEVGYNVGFTGTNDVYTYRSGDTAASIRFGEGGGDITFRTAPTGSSGASLTLTERMRIDQGGNVGIGTDGPTAALDVNGGARVRNLASCDTLSTDANGNIACASFPADSDTSASNEIQTLGTSGNTITLTSGGSVTAPYATSAGNAGTLDSLDSSQFVRADTRSQVAVNSRGTGYTAANFEVYTSDNTPPGIAFHRGGYSATNLYESGGQLYNQPWSGSGGIIWNAGNDGSGSGLDADTLDGLSSASFDQSNSNEIQTLGTSGSSITLTSGGSITAPYATSAGNADTVDGYHASSFSSSSHTHSGLSYSGSSTIGSDSSYIYAYKTISGYGGYAFAGSNLLIFESTDDFYFRGASATNVAYIHGGNGQYTALSDIRKKENISTVNNSVDLIKQLRGVKFTWKNLSEDAYGVIAQETEKVVPELVEEGEDGYKYVYYDGFVPILIEAVKEQQIMIEELRDELCSKDNSYSWCE